MCRELGVPVATHKTEGPATQLTFLGIQADTLAMSLSLLRDKLTGTCPLLAEQEDCFQVEVAVPHRTPQPCSNGGVARPHIPLRCDEDGRQLTSNQI